MGRILKEGDYTGFCLKEENTDFIPINVGEKLEITDHSYNDTSVVTVMYSRESQTDKEIYVEYEDGSTDELASVMESYATWDLYIKKI